MKNLKKIAALFMVGAMTISVGGCGKKELPQTTTTNNTPTNSGNTQNTTTNSEISSDVLVPEEGAKLLLWTDKKVYGEAVAEAFMAKYKGIQVTTEEFGSTDQAKKIELDGPAGTGADVFFLPHDQLSNSISSGIVEPIDPITSKRLNETIVEKAMGTVTKDGIVYGVPVSIEAVGLFYNKAVVDKPVKTFEEMFEFAKTFNNPAENKYAFVMDIANAYTSYAFFTPHGFQVFGPDGTDADNPGFDSEAFIKGLGFIKSLNQILPVKSADLKGEFTGQLFKSGKAAYILEGPWKIEEYKKENIDFGVITLPTVEGNNISPFAGVQMACVSAYSEYPNAATLLAEFMATPEGANILYSQVYKATSLKDISAVEGLADDEFLSVFVEQFKTSFPMPSITRTGYYWSIGEKALSLTFDGQTTPEEASQKAMEEWNSLVASE